MSVNGFGTCWSDAVCLKVLSVESRSDKTRKGVKKTYQCARYQVMNASIRHRFALQTHLRKPSLLAFHHLLFHHLRPCARFRSGEVGDQEDVDGFEEGGEDACREGDVGDVIIPFGH